VITLEEVVETLENSVHRTIEDLVSRFDCSPYEVKDTNGRYILLDALVALTNAKAVLRERP
jgi:hypothetical protein